MSRSNTLIRVEQLLDIFHDGFHKLLGSSERRFKKGLKTVEKQILSNKKDVVIKDRLKSLAREQDNQLKFEKALQERKEISNQMIKERIDGLDQDQSVPTIDNDIEI